MDCPENFIVAIHGMQSEAMAGLQLFHTAIVDRLDRDKRLNEIKTAIERRNHGKPGK